ncbi:hypothetical protein Scep_023089 [Stephania cephalantha]|uniref:Response regulatory domain-containing protein n=1 Tax=Stephania cephalantha TaxID=152367 RepID=A0AAP0I2R8_9MAGN
MSGNCDASLALRAIEGGAWSFIGKPVTVDVLKNLWQYAFQHKKSELREIEKAAWLALKSPGKDLDLGNNNEANNASNESNINKLTNCKEEMDPTKLVNQGSERSKRKSCAKEKGSDEYKEDKSKEKKNVAEENDCKTEKKKQMRATWTEELHQKFVNAINKIGEGSMISCLFYHVFLMLTLRETKITFFALLYIQKLGQGKY